MIKELFLKVSRARKFVLAKSMSAFLAELHDGLVSGSLRKRNAALENARRLSRLPHPLTWIEFDYPEYFEWLRMKKGYTVSGHAQKPPSKLGWLLEQHPKNDAAFKRTEIWSSVIAEGQAVMHPSALAWCGDDEPSPWRRWPVQTETSEAAVVEGYHSMQAHLTAAFTETVSTQMLDAICAGRTEGELFYVARPTTTLFPTWGLLATINDLPVRIETVQPSKGYVARGSYKKFLQHSVIHLTVPETRWRALVIATATLLRRRAHQVRGHWRKDWRHPPSPHCEHRWAAGESILICSRCEGRSLWIAEHQRGDASIGFVTHDYVVEREHA
jgi:hypothetical protein